MQAVLYECPPVPLESEDGMATVESLNKEISTLAQRVTAMETELRIWGKIIGGAGLIVGLGALGWSIRIGNKVTAIEQRLVDGGNTQLVAELKAPKSTEQLRANLSTVTAQVQSAQAEGRKPDRNKINALSGAVAQAVQSHPKVPEAWLAASALISLRSQNPGDASIPSDILKEFGPPEADQGNCFTAPMTFTPSGMPDTLLAPKGASDQDIENATVTRIHILIWHDCTLDLGDTKGFYQSKYFEVIRNRPPVEMNGKAIIPTEFAFALTLVRVRVIYHGGPLIPLIQLSAYGCRFEIYVPEAPPKSGGDLLEALLSEDFNKTNLNLKIPAA